MARYMKYIQAIQYTGENLTEVKHFLGIKNLEIDEETHSFTIPEFYSRPDGSLWRVRENDWIERNVEGFIVYRPEGWVKQGFIAAPISQPAPAVGKTTTENAGTAQTKKVDSVANNATISTQALKEVGSNGDDVKKSTKVEDCDAKDLQGSK